MDMSAVRVEPFELFLLAGPELRIGTQQETVGLRLETADNYCSLSAGLFSKQNWFPQIFGFGAPISDFKRNPSMRQLFNVVEQLFTEIVSPLVIV